MAALSEKEKTVLAIVLTLTLFFGGYYVYSWYDTNRQISQMLIIDDDVNGATLFDRSQKLADLYAFDEAKLVIDELDKRRLDSLTIEATYYYEAKKLESEVQQRLNWNGSHPEAIRIIKESMHNPKSFKHIETEIRYTQYEYIVRVKFRGQNAFGATVENVEYVHFDRNHNQR